MFGESYLIEQIKTATGYTDVTLAQENSTDPIHERLIAPRIQVGHLGIKPERPQDIFANGYNELGNSEMLMTEIQILCERDELPTVRTAVKDAYVAFSPFPDDHDFSSLVFLEAKVVGVTGTKVRWSEIVGLVMPRVSN